MVNAKMEKPVMVSPGLYKYRGHTIRKHDGRGVSHWRYVWEITDDSDGTVVNHWPSLWTCLRMIDKYMEETEK